MSSEAPQQRYIPPSRRRDKPILSCNLCRRRKLKCDRQQPCKACVDRGLSLSCTFSRSSQTPPIPDTRATHKVHDRIDQLERLVTTLMSEKQNGLHESASPMVAYSPSINVGDPDPDIPGTPDRVKLENDETTYTNSGHWTSILDGIAELKESLDEIPRAPQAGYPRDEITGPDLLFSRHKHATLPEILSALPSKGEADQMVIKYYTFMDMAPTLMHRPTFQREYDTFWENPSKVPIMWLGLLFSVFAIACRFESNVEEWPGTNTDPARIESISTRVALYREKVVQCLILGDYTKCPPYTLELFLSYFVMEYLRSRDTQFGIWLLCGTLVRIALKMGYHREPSRFPNITPFHGEMRRRIWTMIIQVDFMTSMQNGLPRMIQPYIYDVREPRNLTDADLDENMAELPPSRPETESTVTLYSVVRNRGLAIMARIVDLANTAHTTPYRETMELDAALRAYYEQIPSSLKGKTAVDFNGESDVAMRRMYIGVTFLKASLMLHRPYILFGRTDSRYAYSRMACLDAALEILEFQALLDRESFSTTNCWSVRWRLWTSGWRQSSIVNHDFSLATTVLLLDLDKDLVSPMPTGPSDVPRIRFKSGQPTRVEIVEALRGAYRIWKAGTEKSRDAVRVVTAIELVLRKIDASDDQTENTAAAMVPDPAQYPAAATAPNASSDDPFALFAQQQAYGSVMDGATADLFDFDNTELSLPFPMADIPMDFGGFDWGNVAAEYPLPSFDSDIQNGCTL